LAIAIVAGGAATFYHFSTAKLQIGSDVRDRLTRSVFLVNTPTSGGTAFPIGPHLLATNSHVGELYEELKPGQKMVVRSPGREGKIYEVIDHKLHPGYRASRSFLSKMSFANEPLSCTFLVTMLPSYRSKKNFRQMQS